MALTPLRHGVTKCPHCGKDINAASSIDDMAATPEPGDFSLCFGCAGFLKFGDNLELLPMTYDDIVDLPPEHRTPLLQQRDLLHGFLKARGLIE